MAVGSLIALPIVPYTADLLGRRAGVAIGCTIMFVPIPLLPRFLEIKADAGIFIGSKGS
jgi:hypothetical protein